MRLENVHFYLRPCVPQDIPKEAMDINQFYAALANTTKNVMAAAQSVQSARDVIEMAGMIAGGEAALVEETFHLLRDKLDDQPPPFCHGDHTGSFRGHKK